MVLPAPHTDTTRLSVLKNIGSVAQNLKALVAPSRGAPGLPAQKSPTRKYPSTPIPKLNLPSAQDIVATLVQDVVATFPVSASSPCVVERISDQIWACVKKTQDVHIETFERTCERIPPDARSNLKSVYESMYPIRHLPGIREKVIAAIKELQLEEASSSKRRHAFNSVSPYSCHSHSAHSHTTSRNTPRCLRSILTTTPIPPPKTERY